MTFARRPGIRLFTALVSSLLVACAGDSASSPTSTGLLAAKGGGGGAGPKVNAADPSIGDQGQQLNVRVLGSGYNPTAVASWERNGAPDPKITVNSTTFVSSSELVANITIAADADTVFYDVAVEILLSDGSRKKGVGIEKFEVASNSGGASHPANSIATSTGAVFSDGAQPVDGVETDTTVHLVNAARQDGDFRARFGFALTYAAYRDAVALGQPPCQNNGNKNNTATRRAGLFAKLMDPTFRDRILSVNVSKPALGSPSALHQWNHTWNETSNGVDSLFTGFIKEVSKSFPGVVPTVVELAPYTYQFTGGVVAIWDRTGGAGNHLWIGCPNLDAAVITWVPPTP